MQVPMQHGAVKETFVRPLEKEEDLRKLQVITVA